MEEKKKADARSRTRGEIKDEYVEGQTERQRKEDRGNGTRERIKKKKRIVGE